MVICGFHRILFEEEGILSCVRRVEGQLLPDVWKKRTAFIRRVVTQFTASVNLLPQFENRCATNKNLPVLSFSVGRAAGLPLH